tara:strand:- start:178 stop:369 length:192 start_codon:yes stop_codon:yes gene_type:complete
MVSTPLPKGTKPILRRRSWGIERSHITSMGNEIFTPAPFEGANIINRKFKIFKSDLIDLGYLG